MFDSIKMYAALIGTVVVGIFIAIFNYRGNKIEDLEHEMDVIDKVVKADIEAAEFVADNRVEATKAEVTDETSYKLEPSTSFSI